MSAPQQQTMDLAFMLDVTGSMSSWINASKRVMNDLVGRVRAATGESVTLRCAVVAYRDTCDRAEIQFEVQNFTEDEAEFSGFVAGLRATGGGDFPEDVLGATEKAVHELQWNSGTRVLVVIADAPPHGVPRFHDGHDNHPEGNTLASGRTWETLLPELQRLGVALGVCHIQEASTGKMAAEFARLYEPAGRHRVRQMRLGHNSWCLAPQLADACVTELQRRADAPERALTAPWSEPKPRTERGAAAEAADPSAPHVEAYFKGMLRGAAAAETERLLAAVWAASPRRAVALVFQARDCRRGKGERAASIDGLAWLRREHPDAYAANIARCASELGCFKDLLTLAVRAEAESQPRLGARGEFLELEVLADALAADRERLEEWRRGGAGDRRPPGLSLAAKWAPSSRGHHDRHGGGLARRVAALVCARGKRNPTLRADYRRLLSALRRHLGVVEALMTAGRWSEINFSGVPGRAMTRYRAAFARRDAERFAAFLGDARAGKVRIAQATVHPHELVRHYLEPLLRDGRLPDEDDAIEAQWAAAVRAHAERARKADEKAAKAAAAAPDKEEGKDNGGGGGAGGLRVLPVVDVSGSMYDGQAVYASVALGLLMSLGAPGAMHRRVVTFASRPQWHVVEGDSLRDQVRSLHGMAWGGFTNLGNVFRLVARTAAEAGVDASDLPRTVVVLSDQQYDEAVEDATALAHARAEFDAAGYEAPNVVFWNLAASKDDDGADTRGLPATADEQGVALISGFSASSFRTLGAAAAAGARTPAEVVEVALRPYEAMVAGLPA